MASKIDLVLKVTDDGFKGVHKRLDKINGSLDSHETRLDKQGEALIRFDERQKQPFGGAGLGGWIANLLIKIMK